MKPKRLLPLVISLALFIAGCNPPAPQGGNNQGNNIEIQITSTESKEINTETIHQPNCSGTAEVENVVERSRTIEYVMDVQNGVTLDAKGQVGFAGTDVELGAAVASQFGLSYGASETLTRSITVRAKPGTDMQHIIRQAEVWQVGNATVSVGGQEEIIPFKFRSDFSIELVNSQDMKDCGNSGTIAAPIPSTQYTALPSQTPPVADQGTSSLSYVLPTSNDISTFAHLMEGISYKNPTMPSSINYYVNVKAGLSYVWQFIWCAQDRNYLSNDLSSIDIKFLVEDSEIPSQDIYEYGTSESGWECLVWATLLSGWVQGEKTTLTLSYLISGPIFDGKYKYQPGQYRHDIFVTAQ